MAPASSVPQSDLVQVIVPVHNRRELTMRFIQHLLLQDHPRWKLLLVDDGCTDGTVEGIRALVPAVEVLAGKGNWWWGGALHQAWRRLKRSSTGAGYALIINDDTAIPPDFLTRGLGRMRPGLFLQAQMRDPNGSVPTDRGTRIDWPHFKFSGAPSVAEIDCLSTRGLLMGMGDFLATGGFRPFWLPHYCSDYEFTFRAARHGIRLETHEDFALDSTDLGAPKREEELWERGWDYLAWFFSKRCPTNPFALIAFCLLCAPWPWKAILIFRRIASTGLTLWKVFRKSARGRRKTPQAGR